MTPTTQQAEAISAGARNVLCIAGPGSGKTWTLIARILRKLADGADPTMCAVITYTNAAAKELIERLGAHNITLGYIGTLHGWCLRYVQQHREGVTVLSEDDADAELERVGKQIGFRASLKQLQRSKALWRIRKQDDYTLVVQSYYRQMEANRTLDFDGLLEAALELLIEYEAADINIVHLFVDEIPDAAKIDFDIYNAMDAENRFYCGDPDQSIFAFRGAYPHRIYTLSNDINWQLLKLEGNFRSGAQICAAAERLIVHNEFRVPKAITSLTETQGVVSVMGCASDTAEAAGIAASIQHRIAHGADPREFAVLARTHTIVNGILEAMAGFKVPVRKRIIVDVPHDWQMARAALAFLSNRTEEAALKFDVLMNGMFHAEQLRRNVALGVATARGQLLVGLEATDASVLRDLVRMGVGRASLDRLKHIWEGLPNETLAELIIATAYREETEEVGEGVTVSTIHGAKGHEWRTVVLAGLEEGVLPSLRVRGRTEEQQAEDIEEERRLAYVGMTRAKEELFLTFAWEREQPFGRRELVEMRPSRFIEEAGLAVGIITEASRK